MNEGETKKQNKRERERERERDENGSLIQCAHIVSNSDFGYKLALRISDRTGSLASA